MFSVIFFKVAAELALYYSLFVVTPKLFNLSTSPFITIALLSLGILTASFLKSKHKRNLRYLGLIFVVIAFFLSLQTVADFASIVPPCLYVTYIIHKGNFDLDPLDVRKEFGFTLAGAGILFVVLLVMDWLSEIGIKDMLPAVAETNRNLIVPMPMIKYLVLFIIMMALAMRQARYDSDYQKGFNVMQWMEAGLTLVPAVIAIVVIINIGPPILNGIGNALGKISINIDIQRESNYFFQWRKPTGKIIETTPYEPEQITKDDQTEKEKEEVEHFDEHPEDDPDMHYGEDNLLIDWPYHDILSNPLLLFGIFIGIIIIAVAILLWRNTKRLKTKREIKTTYNIRDAKDEEIVREKKKNKVKVFSNRAKVRRVYCDFLDIIKKNGITLNNHMTSEEVYEKIRTVFDDDSAKALRNVYIKARYDDFSDVSNEEVRDAKQALNGIKKLS